MKVFISWSGALSKKIAELFKLWIGDVLQGIEPWISTEDIDKGSVWFGDISDQLKNTSVGVLFLTRENINAPWVLFEAGALSKGLSKNRVCTLLIDLQHSELKPPLSLFNGTLPSRDDMRQLVQTINVQSGKSAIPDVKVAKSFDKWWSDFESKFAVICKDHTPTDSIKKRPAEDMIEEILEITRVLHRAAQEQATYVARVSNNPFVGAALSSGDLARLQSTNIYAEGARARMRPIGMHGLHPSEPVRGGEPMMTPQPKPRGFGGPPLGGYEPVGGFDALRRWGDVPQTAPIIDIRGNRYRLFPQYNFEGYVMLRAESDDPMAVSYGFHEDDPIDRSRWALDRNAVQ